MTKNNYVYNSRNQTFRERFFCLLIDWLIDGLLMPFSSGDGVYVWANFETLDHWTIIISLAFDIYALTKGLQFWRSLLSSGTSVSDEEFVNKP